MKLLGLRVEVLHLPEARLPRRERRRRMIAAESRLILRPPKTRRHPDAPFAVHRSMIRDGRIEPVGLAAPVRRWLRHHLRFARRSRRVEHRDAHFRRRMRIRIESEETVVTPIDAVDRTVGVRRRVALVGRKLVVGERRGPAPLPERQHEIALDTFRARRRGRHLAGRDPIGPVREHRERGLAAECPMAADHRRAVLSRPAYGDPTRRTTTRTTPSPAGNSRVARLPS